MKKNYQLSSIIFIQLAIGLYFSITGLLGIIGFNSGTNQLVNDFNKLVGKSNYLPLIISIIFLISGLILITGIVLNFKNRVIFYFIVILWGLYIVSNFITSNFLKPDLLLWLKGFSYQLIIIAGLWSCAQRK